MIPVVRFRARCARPRGPPAAAIAIVLLSASASTPIWHAQIREAIAQPSTCVRTRHLRSARPRPTAQRCLVRRPARLAEHREVVARPTAIVRATNAVALRTIAVQWILIARLRAQACAPCPVQAATAAIGNAHRGRIACSLHKRASATVISAICLRIPARRRQTMRVRLPRILVSHPSIPASCPRSTTVFSRSVRRTFAPKRAAVRLAPFACAELRRQFVEMIRIARDRGILVVRRHRVP